MHKPMIVGIAMLALACHNQLGNRGNAVGPAWLDTVYLRSHVQVVYVLYVADVGSPKGHGTWAGGGSFGSWSANLQREYVDHGTRTRIAADPVVIRRTTLRADGKSFNLMRGNVLVVHMSPSGSLTVTQLLGRRGANETPNSIVSLVKSALPHDTRVQALPLS